MKSRIAFSVTLDEEKVKQFAKEVGKLIHKYGGSKEYMSAELRL